MEEIRKPVVGYEGKYEVSNLGNVRSLNFRGKKGVVRILSQGLNSSGYCYVRLTKKGKCKMFLVHRLVCVMFASNPESKKQVNHVNGNRTDNRVENLERCTVGENMLHAVRILGRRNSEKQRLAVARIGKANAKPILQFSLDGKFIKERGSAREAERKTGVNNGNIGSCCTGLKNNAGGYIRKHKST